MHRHLLLAATVAALPFAAAPASAVTLIQYNFAGQSGDQASTAATSVAGSLAGLAFTRGAGLAASAGANSINASGWSTAANDYYDFGFTISGGVSATVNQLIFGEQASATGPGAINVLASVDGGAFNQVGSFAIPTASTNFSQALALTAPVTASNRVEFRFVAANTTAVNGGAIAAAGTFRVTNYLPGTTNAPFTIDGTVTQAAAAVPEPASWAMMIAGFGLAGAALRRRPAARRFA